MVYGLASFINWLWTGVAPGIIRHMQGWCQEFSDTGAKFPDMGAKLELRRFQRQIIVTADKPQHLFQGLDGGKSLNFP